MNCKKQWIEVVGKMEKKKQVEAINIESQTKKMWNEMLI